MTSINAYFKIRNIPSDKGKPDYEKVELWVDGVCFSSDLKGDIMERQIKRMSDKYEIEIIDTRDV